jgi:hypothetical protein
MIRALVLLQLAACTCGEIVIDHPDSGTHDAGTHDAGNMMMMQNDAGPLACPIDGGVDGAGVCTQWTFGGWDSPCTNGYTRTRSCDPAYDCRVDDHNGCAAAVNVGGRPPAGCAECPGGRGSLDYFGYWRDSDIQNFVCQIQDHANFSMNQDDQGAVDFAASFGVASFGFTVPTSGTPVPLGAALVRDDADASAYGWCQNHPGMCPNGIQDGWAAVKAEIEAEGDRVRSMHPNAHLLINLADGDANGELDFRTIPGFTLPRGIDWVGLECYTGAANCQANMNVLRPLLPPGARTWVISAGTNGYGSESYLVSDAQAMFDWANQDSAVIGMIAFVWSKAILCPPDCNALAVKEMPLLLAKYRELGDRITGRTNVDPKPDNQCPAP